MNEQMKPCPFCGEARFARVRPYPWKLEGEDDLVWGFHVICDASGLDNMPRGCGAASGWAETEAEAIAAWNRRTPSREAVLEEAAKVAERDVDWTMFARQPKKDWKTGEETNVFAPMDDPDNTIPTPVNVFAYANGIAAGRAIAAAIRSLSKPSESAT